MNAIFYLNGPEYATKALCKVMDNMELENTFVVAIDEIAMKDVKVPCVEKYLIRKEIALMNYNTKVDFENLTPLEPQILDAISPYMSSIIKMYGRIEWGELDYEERLRRVLIHLEYWNHIIEKYKIDSFIYTYVPHEIYDYIIYALCKVKGIKTCFTFYNTTFRNSYLLSDVNMHCPNIKEEYQNLLEQYKDASIDEIILDEDYKHAFDVQSAGDDLDKTPFYMKNMKKVEYSDGKPKMPPVIQRSLNMLNNFKKHGVVGYVKDVYLPAREAGNKVTQRANNLNQKLEDYNNHWQSKCQKLDLENIKYFYFPLHMQPECTTLPLGGWFENQILAVKMLAAALPKDVYVLVKENPKQKINKRSIELIDDFCAIKNVKLVSRNTDTYKLLDNCLAVGSITGTAIWEGIFKNKPAVMFGHFITEHAPGVFRVETNKACKSAVGEILSGRVSITLKELKIFMLAMQNISHEGDLQCVKEGTEDELVARTYNMLVQMLKENAIEVKQTESVTL